jgi:hypothetical protein
MTTLVSINCCSCGRPAAPGTPEPGPGYLHTCPPCSEQCRAEDEANRAGIAAQVEAEFDALYWEHEIGPVSICAWPGSHGAYTWEVEAASDTVKGDSTTRALAIRAALAQADTWLASWRAEVRAAAVSEGVDIQGDTETRA